MLNTLLNRATQVVLRRKMRVYQAYPRSKTALILIDVKPEFIVGQPDLKPNLDRLIGFVRQQGIAIIFSNFGGERPDRPLPPAVDRLFFRLDSASSLDHAEEVSVVPGDLVLPTRSCLSVFFEEALSEYLNKKGIEHVVIAGGFADLSIDSSARHSSELGFHTTVLSDCCGATSEGGHRATMAVTLPRMVHAVMTSEAWFAEVEDSNIDD